MNENVNTIQIELYDNLFKTKPIYDYYINTVETDEEGKEIIKKIKLDNFTENSSKYGMKNILKYLFFIIIPIGSWVILSISLYNKLSMLYEEKNVTKILKIFLILMIILIGLGFSWSYLCIFIYPIYFFELFNIFCIYLLSVILCFLVMGLYKVNIQYIESRVAAIIRSKPELCLNDLKTLCYKLWSIMKFGEKMTIFIFAFDETSHFDIQPSTFKYKIFQGSQLFFIKTLQESVIKSYDYIDLSKNNENPIIPPIHTYNDGIELLAMVLTQLNPQGIIGLLKSVYIPALTKFFALILPIYLFPNKAFSNYFFALPNILRVILLHIGLVYVSMTGIVYSMLILGGKIKDFYGQMKWLGRLINLNVEREENYSRKTKIFKLNIFCEKTLSTWCKIVLILQRAWIKYIRIHEIGMKIYIVYLAIFIGFGLAMFLLDCQFKSWFAYGYLLFIIGIEIIISLMPIIYYLYYGYCVNKTNIKIISILKYLLILYTEMDEYLDYNSYPDVGDKFINDRQKYFWMALKGELDNRNNMNDNEDLKKQAKDKLHKLKIKIQSIIKKLEDELNYRSYKFCGVLACNLTTYQAVTATILTILYPTILKIIDILNQSP